MSIKIINTIRQQVASDIRLSASTDTRIRIGTPFLYDDGDSCGFFLERNESEGWAVTDFGDVLMRAGYADVDLLSEGYKTRLGRTMEFFGITESDGSMILPVVDDRFGDAIFTFAQASLEMVRLAHLPKERKLKEQSKFKRRFTELITKTVPSNNLEHNWHDPSSDPEGLYPVDFRIHSDDQDWYVFGIGTQNKCLHATISCQRYKILSRPFSGLAIYRDKGRLPENATKPLDAVVEEKFSSIAESDQIEGFIHDRILKRAG